MNNTRSLSIQEIKKLLHATSGITFKAVKKKETYSWMEDVLISTHYRKLKKKEKGIVKEYLQKMTGYSHTQTTSLITQFKKYASIKVTMYHRHSFNQIYTDTDAVLLAEVDDVHKVLSGAATKKILEREYKIFKKEEFKNLSHISSSHIYNIRRRQVYRNKIRIFIKTQSTQVPIGKREKPRPNGRPGFLRVDSVHQGDSASGEKGVYHINLVDEVLQWEIVVCVEKISERFLVPALEAALEQMPFKIRNFHADNGSEYINYKVAEMLDRLLIKLTKSRPRRSNDNGLVETKNGSIIRKHLGYSHIPQPNADVINEWYQKYFNVYLNFHRPCGFPKEVIDRKGKRKITYPPKRYAIPYEKMKSLKKPKRYLKKGVTFEQLDKIAYAESDTEYGRKMNKEKEKFLKKIHS